MGHDVDHLTCVVDDIRAGIDRDALADGLTADGQGRHQARKHQRHDGRKAQPEIAEDLGGNGRRSGAGDDAADITDNVIADGTDALGVPKEHDALLRAPDLPGRHCVEGFFVGGSHGHADNIKNDADEDDHQQNEKGHDHGAFAHDKIGHQADGGRGGDGGKENGDDPVPGPAFFFHFRGLRVGFCQDTFS